MTALVSYASSDDEEEEKVEFTKASEQSSAVGIELLLLPNPSLIIA